MKSLWMPVVIAIAVLSVAPLRAGQTNVTPAYVAADEWTPPPKTCEPPMTNEWLNQQHSDWSPARNSVRLTNLMANAALIVEARAITSAALMHYNASNAECREPHEDDLDLTKLRVLRIVASCWSEAETRQRLAFTNDVACFYVAERPAADSDIVNDPCLFRNERYLLWLVPLALTDAQFARIQSYAYEPIRRSAIYTAYVGRKGCVPLDEHKISFKCSPTISNQFAQRSHDTAESSKEYLINSYNTTNKNDIVEAVRHLARAMSHGADKTGNLQQAKRNLNGAAKLSLDRLPEMERFQWTDAALPGD